MEPPNGTESNGGALGIIAESSAVRFENDSAVPVETYESRLPILLLLPLLLLPLLLPLSLLALSSLFRLTRWLLLVGDETTDVEPTATGTKTAVGATGTFTNVVCAGW